jgi:hypothetical protein
MGMWRDENANWTKLAECGEQFLLWDALVLFSTCHDVDSLSSEKVSELLSVTYPLLRVEISAAQVELQIPLCETQP